MSKLEDGNYTIETSLKGGSGRASIESPTPLKVEQGDIKVTITWSSPYYDYMQIGEEYYYPVNTEGNSEFEIPVNSLEEDLSVKAETLAMSKPHVISYTIGFDESTLKHTEIRQESVKNNTNQNSKGYVLYGSILMSAIFIIGCGVYVFKRRKKNRENN